MKRTTAIVSFIALLIMGAACFKMGEFIGKKDAYQIGYMGGLKNLDSMDRADYHYVLHAEQLTANDIPVYFVDELPGMGGTKAKPDTCLAYYDTVKKAVWYSYLNTKNK